MNDKSFIDTNIFVYAAGAHDPVRTGAADRLIKQLTADRNGFISTQVITEFLSVVLRKFSPPYTTEAAREYVSEVFLPLSLVETSFDLYGEALEVFRHNKLSWFDAMIVGAAVRAGCASLYTEDMQHGAIIRGVKIVNPFLTN